MKPTPEMMIKPIVGNARNFDEEWKQFSERTEWIDNEHHGKSAEFSQLEAP